jgi:hypothetical protein
VYFTAELSAVKEVRSSPSPTSKVVSLGHRTQPFEVEVDFEEHIGTLRLLTCEKVGIVVWDV